MPSLAEPHLPAVGRPMLNARVRHQAATGDRAMEYRRGGRKDVGPKLGMDAVGGDDDISLGGGAIGERHPGCVTVLLKTAAAMSGTHRSGRQRIGQHVDEVGAMHSEGSVPP